MQKTHNWPTLNYSEWKNTCETLHLWIQIVGKLKLSKMPCTNHSWHCTLFVTSRGFSTLAMPDGERNFTVEFDFIDHKLNVFTSDSRTVSLLLKNESVSSFYARFLGCLKKLKIEAHFDPHPSERVDYTPFSEDFVHCTYVPHKAHRFWQIMVRVNNVMNVFRSIFIGKSSPVHLFWGSFDLAVTRFSGRLAPEHPAGVPHIPDLVVKEAYSQEVSSCGFWPGNEMHPRAAFYSYAYPEPEGFNKAHVEPFEAYYNESLKEFILPYDIVVKSHDPAAVIMSFFETTYNTAADLGNWNRRSLEESVFLTKIKEPSFHDRHFNH